MNNERRKRIREIAARVQEAMDALDAAKGELEEIRDEEQAANDNMPESLQEGERGQAMQEAIDNIETAIECIESIDQPDFDVIVGD